MIRKFFPLDKNYLLEQAQLQTKDCLLSDVLIRVGRAYEAVHNPLGLEDDFVRKIRQFKPNSVQNLDEFYYLLCGLYRYRYGNNQLELLWDGSDHLTRYKSDWQKAFCEWIDHLCSDPLFVQAVLDLTVFFPEDQKPALAEVRMQHFIRSHFSIKIHRTKGIVAA